MKFIKYLIYFTIYISTLCSCVTSITLHNKTLYKKNTLTVAPPQQWEETQTATFFGLATSPQKIKAMEKCPGEIYLIEIKRSVSNVLALLLTVGIYSPFTVRIVCLPQTTITTDSKNNYY